MAGAIKVGRREPIRKFEREIMDATDEHNPGTFSTGTTQRETPNAGGRT